MPRPIAAVLTLALLLAQREEDNPAPMPADAAEKTEWAFARLKYPNYQGGGRYWRGSWTTDYPKADRQFVQGVRRLTRLHAKSIEQVVDVHGDDLFNWPWIYAVEVGHWGLDEKQSRNLRDYLNRGGFLMVDDFHGTREWSVFTESMNRVFPGRPIVDLQNAEQIFHVIYDLGDRFQVPGIGPLSRGRTYEQDGFEPRWRGIYDEKGRILVAHRGTDPPFR